MEKFIKIEDDWWLWDLSHMKAININGGGFDIDENSSYFMNAEVRECNSWHDLYIHTGYSPFLTDYKVSDCWLSPDGKFWEAEAHAVQAEKICFLVYGVEFDILDWADAAEYLIELGWKKLTRGPMWQFYVSDCYMNWKVTCEQKDAINQYCEYHKIKIPDMRLL